MVSNTIFFLAILVIGLIIIGFIILLVWWLRLKKIKKKAPDFEGSTEDWRLLNYDQTFIERRNLIKNGNTERGARLPQKEASRDGTDESEIARIREQIRRKEREIADSRGD